MTLICRVSPPSPDSPTLVLLHGIQGTAAAWNEVIAHLPPDLGVVAPNLRGRAGSYSPDDPGAYRLADFSGDLAGLLEMLARPVWLCGWSMGVLVALDYLSGYGKQRVAGLILASGTACLQGEAQWFAGETPDEIGREASARAARLGLKESAITAAAAGAWLSARDADLREILPRIVHPTLVIHGGEDDQCPVHQGRALAEAIPDARFELWEGGGHNLMKEDTARFAGLVAGFVRSTPRSE